MKVKKEYLFLAVIIIALCVYLILRNRDRTHYVLPELPKVEKTEITGLVVSRADSSITLKRRDDKWSLHPQGYPADQEKVDKMLDAVSGLTLTALVSESRNYSPYELTDDKKIGVEALGEGGALSRFDIGKPATTYRHTYIRVDNNPAVYQVRENIRRIFDVQVDKLRDRTAVKLDKEAISEIAITSGGESITILKNDLVPVPMPPTGDDSVAIEPPPPWQTADGREAKESELNRVINRLVNLQCDSYIEGATKADFTNPIFTITVKSSEEATLSIFEKREDNKYPAVSSQNDYPFLLPEWTANQIMKKPPDLVVEQLDE